MLTNFGSKTKIQIGPWTKSMVYDDNLEVLQGLTERIKAKHEHHEWVKF
jgi:hypothetical protein